VSGEDEFLAEVDMDDTIAQSNNDLVEVNEDDNTAQSAFTEGNSYTLVENICGDSGEPTMS
jgi:hypothetical protein